MILSPSQVCEQESLARLGQEVLAAFAVALRTDLGMTVLGEIRRAGSLEEWEQAALKLRTAVFTPALQATFQETGYRSSRVACECGGRRKYVKSDDKWYVTLLGEVQLSRAKYRCLRCGDVERPLDEAWGLPDGRFSVGVQRIASMLGACMPFARAGAVLEELSGVAVSARHIEEITEGVGAWIGQHSSSEAAVAARGDVETEPDCDVLVVALDGGMVNTREQGWKEVKLGALQSLHREDEETLVRGDTSYTAHLGSVDPFRDLVWSEATRRGEKGREATVVLGDGAPWIWNIADEILPEAIQILDWYHLAEHVHETKRLVFDGREKSGKAWVQRILGHLWFGRLDKALQSIRRTRAPGHIEQERLGDLRRYIETHRCRMGYHKLQARGYPVGSGVVESGIKQVVHQRHKQAGMRWSQDHLRKMLNVSTCLRSDRWDELWASQRRAA